MPTVPEAAKTEAAKDLALRARTPPSAAEARIPKRYVGDRGRRPATLCSRRPVLSVFC
jgi:hypothetical protein